MSVSLLHADTDRISSGWRDKTRTHEFVSSEAAKALGLTPETTTYYAAMRAAGFAHISFVERAVSCGLFKAAKPSTSGNRRIEISSLLNAGITSEAIREAELHYSQHNQANYQRRKARAQHRKEITNA